MTEAAPQFVCPVCSSTNRVAPGQPASAARCGKCGEGLALDKPIDVDDEALERHLGRTSQPVLVDVWAPWCGPCRAMAPHFADAARSLAGEARLLKLNADESTAVRHLGVSGIPALLLFRNGRIVDRRAGLTPANQLAAWVRSGPATKAG